MDILRFLYKIKELRKKSTNIWEDQWASNKFREYCRSSRNIVKIKFVRVLVVRYWLVSSVFWESSRLISYCPAFWAVYIWPFSIEGQFFAWRCILFQSIVLPNKHLPPDDNKLLHWRSGHSQEPCCYIG